MIEQFWAHPPSTTRSYANAVACVAALTPLVALLHQLVPGNLTVLYVPAVIIAGILSGAGPALAASVAAFLAYDVLFVPPEFTLTVNDPQEWVNLSVFLATAAVTSPIVSLARTRAVEARRSEREATTQFRLVNALSDIALDDGLRATAAILVEETGSTAAGIVLGGRMRATAGTIEMLQQACVIGTSDDPTPAAHRTRIAGDVEEGWLVLIPSAGQDARQNQRVLLTAGTLIANAARRDRLMREANEAAVLRNGERLRASMLNAVSHDLRTPLSSMIASAESLLQQDITWSAEEQRAFLTEITVEGLWLDRMVRHLLDFSRIEAGALRLSPSWFEPAWLIEEVVRRLARLTDGHPLTVDVPVDLDAILVDEVATSEAIANLIENAVKHTPIGQPIALRARRDSTSFEVTVEDTGPGIPPAVLSQLFEPFTASTRQHRHSGTGLGLAIARAFIEAQGGSIRAENRADGGARLVVTVPQPIPPATLE